MKKRTFIFFSLFISVSGNAQDPEFSSNGESLLNISPAFAGTALSGRAEAAYRLQWPKLAGAYSTMMTSWDQYFKFGGLGFSYIYDNEGRGLLESNRIELDYSVPIAFHKDSIGKERIVIQPAVAIAYFNKSINFSQLTYGNMIDPLTGVVYPPSNIPNGGSTNLDLSAGLLAHAYGFVCNLSVFHITEPNEGIFGYSRLPMRAVFYMTYCLNIGMIQVVPSLLRMDQQDFETTKLNLDMRMKKFSVGVGYRNQDAWIFSGGYKFADFNIGYSYDYTVNGLKGFTGGAHEIHFAYRYGGKKWENKVDDLKWIY